MTSKEYVQSIYPDAKCFVTKSTLLSELHYIKSNDAQISISWTSEDKAWDYAKSIINFRMINMLER
jgi:hypothetical protein